jgi:hypothetical protein
LPCRQGFLTPVYPVTASTVVLDFYFLLVP